MKRVLTVALAAALLLLSATSAQAQEKKSKKDIQDRWKIEKIAFLTDAMELTTSEAEKFWPVYNKAEAEKKASWKSTMDAYKALNSAIEAGKDDKEVSALLDKYLEALESGKTIDAKYVSEYRKFLSSKKVAKLFIAEEAFRRQQIHRLKKFENK